MVSLSSPDLRTKAIRQLYHQWAPYIVPCVARFRASTQHYQLNWLDFSSNPTLKYSLAPEDVCLARKGFIVTIYRKKMYATHVVGTLGIS